MSKINDKSWVPLERRTEYDWTWEESLLKGSVYTKLHAWLHLKIHANFKRNTIRLKGKKIILHPGELAWSQTTMAKKWRWSKDKVARFINKLEETGLISRVYHRETEKVTTIIKIVDYHPLARDKNESTNESIPSHASLGFEQNDRDTYKATNKVQTNNITINNIYSCPEEQQNEILKDLSNKIFKAYCPHNNVTKVIDFSAERKANLVSCIDKLGGDPDKLIKTIKDYLSYLQYVNLSATGNFYKDQAPLDKFITDPAYYAQNWENEKQKRIFAANNRKEKEEKNKIKLVG